MTTYSGQTTQLLQGVSQQAEKDRAEGQIGEQINCVSDIVQGLRRRPGTQVLKELSGLDSNFTINDKTAVYSYARGDGTEQYIMLLDTVGRVKVFDAITGSGKTVSYSQESANKTYLTATNPRQDLRFHTIADTTFVLNTTKTILSGSTFSPTVENEAICYCVQANYGHTYEIRINGIVRAQCTTAATVTVSSTTQNKANTLSTVDIMKALVDGTGTSLITAVSNLTTTLPSWTFTRKSDVLHIDAPTGFQIAAEDGNHGNDLKAITNSVKSFEDLPKYAPKHYPIEISGTGDEVFDNFWVKWEPASGSATYWDGDGIWQECVAPGYKLDFDVTTMPLTIVRQGDGSFNVEQAAWVDRAAGDGVTNPFPSFVNNTARDIGSFQNRLYMMSGENIVMTRAFDKLAWFAESAAAPADDDPIDSASSDNQVTDLLHSLIFNGSLIAFSHKSQFIHPAEIPVKPADFAVSSNTQFDVSPSVRPVATGNNIVFPTEFGEYTNVWEYNLNTLTGNPECESNTKHVPKYIAGDPIELVANTTTDYVFLRTDGNGGNDIYVMQFYYKNKERQQLAWHKWEFPNVDTIYGMTLIGQKLFLVLERDESYFLEFIDLSLPTTNESEFEYFLDHSVIRTAVGGSWDLGGETWTSRIDKRDLATGADVFVQSTGCANEGFLVQKYYSTEATDWVYLQEPAGVDVLMGHRFTSSGEITKPYVRDQNNRPYTKPTIMEDVTYSVENTGFLKFLVDHAAGVDYEQVFNGMNLNHWQFKIGVASLIDTDIIVPVRDHRELVTLRFESDHHLGFSLMSMDWLVDMQTRGRRSR
jgi:hypothetical protein